MMANILTGFGILVSIISACFAYLAYANSKEITFPRKKAREKAIYVKNFSPEAKAMHEFLAQNIDQKVYLNIVLDGDIDVVYPIEELNEANYSVMLWDDKFGQIPQEEEPSYKNCSGVEISIDQQKDTIGKFGYHRGTHRLQGQFYIYLYTGPYQGIMSAVLTPVKLP